MVTGGFPISGPAFLCLVRASLRALSARSSPDIAFQDRARARSYRTIALACPVHALSISANALSLNPGLLQAVTMIPFAQAVTPRFCCRKNVRLPNKARKFMVTLIPWGLWIFQYLVEGLGQVPGHRSREGSQ
jgi:hypothetical protein